MLRVTLAFLFSVSVVGCNQAQTSQQAPTGGADLNSIRNELEALKIEVEDLKEKQSQDDFDQLFEGFKEIAYLQPGDTGYSVIRYDLGTLTVELSDVKPYANGSKVILKFGNPLASTVRGLKAKVEWGPTNENGSPDNESARSKDFTFTESLRSGAWTNVSVVLEDVPPTELGFVRVMNVAHTGISLNK